MTRCDKDHYKDKFYARRIVWGAEVRGRVSVSANSTLPYRQMLRHGVSWPAMERRMKHNHCPEDLMQMMKKEALNADHVRRLNKPFYRGGVGVEVLEVYWEEL